MLSLTCIQCWCQRLCSHWSGYQTIFLGIQQTHNLLYISTEAPVPKLRPWYHSWPVFLFIPIWHAQVWNAVSLKETASKSPASKLIDFSIQILPFLWKRFFLFLFSLEDLLLTLMLLLQHIPTCLCSKNNATFWRHSTFGEGRDNQSPFLCPQVFTKSFYPAALAPGHASQTFHKN